jgi:hypothetical protein
MERVVAGDEARLVRVMETMAGIGTGTRALKSGFDSTALSFFDDADNDRISQQMLTYLNCRQELLELIFRYRAGNTITVPQLRWRASLIDLAAGCSLYQRSTQFVALFADAPRAQRKLNEGDPAWGIPAGLYNTIRANLTDERGSPGPGPRPISTASSGKPRSPRPRIPDSWPSCGRRPEI